MGLMNEIGRSAGLKVSGVVSSNMVFQRAVPICIRGTAGRSGLMVFGEFLGERKTTVTDAHFFPAFGGTRAADIEA